MDRKMLIHLSVVAAMGLTALGSAAPQGASPFVGHWQAVDPADGSDMRLAIGGPPDGPFKITWTESYLSACGGEAGIGRGTGSLSPDGPDVLEAHMVFECPTTGASIPYDISWRYHSGTDTLSSQDGGVITIWQHAGRAESLPQLNLRVNYGHDWVESFYEAGHTVWVTVTENDGVTVRATAELVTEPKDFWEGESGFQSQPSDWDPGSPDIRPLDWVYGTVDNGQTAQVQIGDISGTIEPGADSIIGTVRAEWFSDEVTLECIPWGSPEPVEMKSDSVFPNGEDEYTCAWPGEWDIEPHQDVGVAYYGPDGHWVANAFFAGGAMVSGSTAGDWFWASGFLPQTPLVFAIYDSQGGAVLAEGTPTSDDGGFVFVGYDTHMQDLVPGQYVVVTDRSTLKGLVLEAITMDVFDTMLDVLSGTARPGRTVRVVAAVSPDEADQQAIEVAADSESGAWLADYGAEGIDITEGMREWSFAQILDEDGDANETGTPPAPPATGDLYAVPDENRIWANGWIEGSEVSLTIFDSAGETVYSESRVVPPPSENPWTEVLFQSGFVLEPGQRIVIDQGGYVRELIVSSLRVTGFDLGAHTISGTGDPGAEFFVQIGDVDAWGTIGDDGTWSVQNENLTGGVWGGAIQPDADGDSTRDVFAAPNPSLYAVPDENRIWANGWIEGGEISLTIFDPDGSEVYTEPRVVPPPDEREWTQVLFDSGFALEPGQRIVINQGGYERELIVSSIHVTGFDLGAQTIVGTGDPGAEFLVRIGGVDAWGTVGDDGTWSVQNGDLAAGVWGEAIQPDEDGDATRDGFQAPAA